MSETKPTIAEILEYNELVQRWRIKPLPSSDIDRYYILSDKMQGFDVIKMLFDKITSLEAEKAELMGIVDEAMNALRFIELRCETDNKKANGFALMVSQEAYASIQPRIDKIKQGDGE